MERSGNSISALETALATGGSQKRLSLDLGISESEISKRLHAIRDCGPILEHLGLVIVQEKTLDALKQVIKDCL